MLTQVNWINLQLLTVSRITQSSLIKRFYISAIFSTTLGRTRVGSACETDKLKDLNAFRDVCLRIFRDFLAVIGNSDAGREFRIIVAEVSVVCHYISN